MFKLLDWLTSRTAISHTGRTASIALLIMRVGIGLMMSLGHGWGKLSNYGDLSLKFSDPYGFGSTVSLTLAVFAEFFCSLALAFGLFTRAAAIPLMITMLTAALIIHGADPWGRKELALMYLIPFVVILIAGPGRYSLDAVLGRKAKA